MVCPCSQCTSLCAGPVDVRAGATLGFEDALGLTRALSLLGGSYTPIAQQLLKVGVARFWEMAGS